MTTPDTTQSETPAVVPTSADFWNQPEIGKNAKALPFPELGTSYTGTVTRQTGPGDLAPDTNLAGVQKTFADGSLMWALVIPLLLDEPDELHPDGHAALWIQGHRRTALNEAMARAGAPANTYPAGGARITMTYVANKPSKKAGYGPMKLFEAVYTLPGNSAPAAAPAPKPAAKPAVKAAAPEAAPVQEAPPAPEATPAASNGGPVALSIPDGLPPEVRAQMEKALEQINAARAAAAQ